MLIVYWINYSCRSRVSVPSELCFLAADLSAFAWSLSAFFVALDFSRWDRSKL